MSTWPPPAPAPNSYAVCLRIKTATGELPPLPSEAVVLATESGQTAPRWHYNPNYGSGYWSWNVSENPTGRLRLRVGFPADGPARGFVMWLDPARGVPVRDATWPGHPFPYTPGSTVIVELRHPEDFWSVAYVVFNPPQAGSPDIGEVSAWAGQTPLAYGPGAGVPANLATAHHASLWPGTYPLAIRHPSYILPATTAPLVVNSSAVYRQVTLALAPQPQPPSVPPSPPTPPGQGQIPPPTSKFAIVTTSVLVMPNAIVALHANVPDSQAAQVQWETSNPQVLAPDARGGSFRGVAPGIARVTARHGGESATLDVLVRPGANYAVRRPSDPNRWINDPWAGPMMLGELCLRFKPAASAAQQQALLGALGLTIVGQSAAGTSFQVSFDPQRWNTRSLVEYLRRDPSIEVAGPNVTFQASGVWRPMLPGEVQPADKRRWQLWKMEAPAAWGAMFRQLANRPRQSILFLDSGLYVENGALPSDLAGTKVDLARSVWVGWWWDSVGLSSLGSVDKFHHGTRSALVAAAAWNGVNTAGVDGDATVVMIKCENRLNATKWDIYNGLEAAVARAGPNTRIVSIIHNMITPDAAAINAYLAPMFIELLKRNVLVVIAAGNQNVPMAGQAITTIADNLTGVTATGAVLVVGGTAEDGVDGMESRWIDGKVGSNYDTPSTSYIELCAPAASLYCPIAPSNSDPTVSGTSVSAPLVAGCAAILRSLLPPDTPATLIKKILIESADPVRELATQTNPRLRLRTDSGHRIGKRVNLWQAVLYAFNHEQQKLWVGLRVTSDRGDVTYVLVDGRNQEEPMSATVVNDPERTARAQATIDPDHVRPIRLVGRAPKPTGGVEDVFRMTLPCDFAAIRQLSPRFVIHRVCFTRGKMQLEKEKVKLPGNEAQFVIRNQAPRNIVSDLEMLFPEVSRPDDLSRRPWMHLDSGDAFAIRVVPLNGPAETKLKVLNEAGTAEIAIPAGEGPEPYLVVPFADEGRFRLRAEFPPGNIGSGADVSIEVWSLNNELVRSPVLTVHFETGARLFRVDPLDGALLKPGGWECYQLWRITYIGPSVSWDQRNQLTLEERYDTDKWAAKSALDRSEYTANGTQGTLLLKASSPSDSALPAQLNATLTLRCKQEPNILYPLTARFQRAKLDAVVTAEPMQVDRVVSGPPNQWENLVTGRFRLKVENRSAFPIRFSGIDAYRDTIPAAVPGLNKWTTEDFPLTGTHIVIAPGQTLTGWLLLYYLREYCRPPQRLLHTCEREVRFDFSDARPVPPSDFGPGGYSQTLHLKTALQFKPPEG